jgi:hypothetical protein
LRELLAMAHARSREEWGRMSALKALVANVNRDPRKSRTFKPSDFDPYAVPEHGGDAKGAIVVDKSTIGSLKRAFTGAAREGGQGRREGT